MKDKELRPWEVARMIEEAGGPVVLEVWDYDPNGVNLKIKDVCMESKAFIDTGCDHWHHARLPQKPERRKITDPKYKPIPTEWTNEWAECRAVDADGRLWEYENNLKDIAFKGPCWYRKTNSERKAEAVSEGHDPTNWQNSLEQRPRNKRPMTPLEAFEFLAEGHEGKPRVWRPKCSPKDVWYSQMGCDNFNSPSNREYSNLSDRDGDTLIWREFPLVEEKI